MKLIKLKALLLLCLVSILCNSCTKITQTGYDPATIYNITYKVDGVAKTATTVTATIYTTQKTIQITGFSGQEGITLSVNTSRTGTFDVIKDTLLLGYSTNTSYQDTYLGLSGTLSITALTTTNIMGTFSFSGSNGGSTKLITDGKFNCRIVKM